MSIKTKISMTFVYSEYEVKNGTRAMTTAKKFYRVITWKLKIVISWGNETLVGGGELFLLRGGMSKFSALT